MKSIPSARAPRTVETRLLAVVAAAIAVGCTSPSVSDRNAVYAQAAGARDDPSSTADIVARTDDLTVVDCLLPGKLRKMGQTITWVGRPRPVKKTASDCEILGGQYVLFDRANYDTALAVWMLAAKEGDPTAQTYVGEIYERGLGRAPDYAEAAAWYRKAAQQGHARAQFRFGVLCEKGLGVPQDSVKALKWYRESAGLPERRTAHLSRAVAKSAPRSKSKPSRQAPTVAATQPAAPSEPVAPAADAKIAAEVATIETEARAQDAELSRTENAVAAKKEQIVIQSRKSRLLEQTASTVQPKRRLIDQYVALSQEAENQRIARDGLKKVLEMSQPVVAKR